MANLIDDPQSFYNFVDLMATDIVKFQITCHSIIDFPKTYKPSAVRHGRHHNPGFQSGVFASSFYIECRLAVRSFCVGLRHGVHLSSYAKLCLFYRSVGLSRSQQTGFPATRPSLTDCPSDRFIGLYPKPQAGRSAEHLPPVLSGKEYR